MPAHFQQRLRQLLLNYAASDGTGSIFAFWCCQRADRLSIELARYDDLAEPGDRVA